MKFANWVGTIKKRKVYVEITKKRPIPLEHFIFCNNKLTQIKDQNNKFMQDTYKKILNEEKKSKEFHGGKKKSKLTQSAIKEKIIKKEENKIKGQIEAGKEKTIVNVRMFNYN